MKDLDIMAVLVDWPNTRDFSKREFEFVAQCAGILANGKELTVAQHQWLQSIYDKLVAFRYGLESMGTDREYATRRSQSKRKKRLEYF